MWSSIYLLFQIQSSYGILIVKLLNGWNQGRIRV